MLSRSKKLIVLLLALAAFCAGFYHFGRSVWVPIMTSVIGKRTLEGAIEEFGPAANERLKPHFQAAGVAFPPSNLTLIGLKEEKRLELWTQQGERWVLIRSYEVKRASGVTGPKLVEGDEQVPEGFYRIEGFNPNSSYHLSLKVNYPNDFDRQQAAADGRTQLGGDIFIHGKAVSIGCLAMGDEAIEDLFVLAYRTGLENIAVVIAPHDLRKAAPPKTSIDWLNKLYVELSREMQKFAD